MKTNKTIFFKKKDIAERFKSLYGGVIDIETNDLFYRRYYGDKIDGLVRVSYRADNEEMKNLCKILGLKEKRWNGKKCYLFE